MRVLLADDSMVSLALLRALVQSWHYEIVTATDGTAAWSELQRENAPELAVLDWVMPGMSGPEICEKLRRGEGRRDTYVILLSGKEAKDDIVAAFEAGADAYLTKPFHHEELRAGLRAGARLIELRSELVEQNRQLEMARAELRTLRVVV
jgi:DNA-binding response OmpR family regulator